MGMITPELNRKFTVMASHYPSDLKPEKKHPNMILRGTKASIRGPLKGIVDNIVEQIVLLFEQ